MSDAHEPLRELLDQARKEGKWLHCSGTVDLVFSPEEVVRLGPAGQLFASHVNWKLYDLPRTSHDRPAEPAQMVDIGEAEMFQSSAIRVGTQFAVTVDRSGGRPRLVARYAASSNKEILGTATADDAARFIEAIEQSEGGAAIGTVIGLIGGVKAVVRLAVAMPSPARPQPVVPRPPPPLEELRTSQYRAWGTELLAASRQDRGDRLIDVLIRDLTDEVDRLRMELEAHVDAQAVRRFANLMTVKMAQGRLKGRTGWQAMSTDELWRMLREHVEKGDPIDVANFAMMIHHNSEIPKDGTDEG